MYMTILYSFTQVLSVLVLCSLQLHSLAGGSGANTSGIVENRILNLFDQLYHSYMLKVRVQTNSHWYT